MKNEKLVSFVMLVMLTAFTHVSIAAVSNTKTAPDSCKISGDVNKDGVVNVHDAVMLLNYIDPKNSNKPSLACPGDINGDKKIDVHDALAVLGMM